MGSKLGWIIAGALVLVVGGVLFSKLVLGPDPSEPTRVSQAPGFLELHRVEMSPAAVVGSEPSRAGNAGEFYAQAVTHYEKNHYHLQPYLSSDDRELRRPDLDIFERLAELAAQGAQRQNMEYTFIYTPKGFKVGLEYEPAIQLGRVARALSRLGRHYYARGEYDKAEKVFADAFMLGYHMDRERSRTAMATEGMNIQVLAAGDLKKVRAKAGRDGLRASTDEYLSKLGSVRSFYTGKMRDYWTIKPKAGDAFNMVANDKDRAWRIQALLDLGRVRFGSSNRGDIKHAEELLAQYANDPDPLIAAAAKAARELTVEEFRAIR
jgi:hypothetical protein